MTDVDPGRAKPGSTFVIHQHHATRLHWDLRLEMMNGRTPVLVSWAVPKNLPLRKGKGALAIKVEDHAFEYGSYSGELGPGYGAGAVRIFDNGTYEMVEQKDGALKFRLNGKRLQGAWRLSRRTREGAKPSAKEEWLAFLSSDDRPEPDPMPPLHPMLATLVDDAFDSDDWSFEPKWDGVRAFAVCGEDTKLISRNSNDITVAYPELHKVHEQTVSIDAVLDGEIVAFEGGAPSFERLQSRMHVRGEADIKRLMKEIPVAYVVFDVIYMDGKDLTSLPYTERRALLERNLVTTQTIQLSPSIPHDGVALFEVARKQNLEGIVAKRNDSKYETDRRSKSWLKMKTTYDGDLVIAGWLGGAHGHAPELGSILTATWDGDRLRYNGSVGTGFSQKQRAQVREQLESLEVDESPFTKEEMKGKAELKLAHWVKPELVAIVEFRQLTGAGKLRAPSFKGLREDKSPEECTFEALREAAGQS